MGNFFCQVAGCLRDWGLWRKKTTNLLSLPPEILISILNEVGQNYGFLCRVKSVCKRLNDIGCSDEFIRNLDLYRMHIPNNHLSGVRIFFDLCLEKANPSALFMRGSWDIFKGNQVGEGLQRIRLAAEKGYPMAIYSYEMLSRILHFENDLRSVLSRDFIRESRNRLSKEWPGWDYSLPPFWIDMVQLIPVPELQNCRCCTNNPWMLREPWDERSKIGNMCDTCFSTLQTLWFSREFPLRLRNWPVENEDEDQVWPWPLGYWDADYHRRRPAYWTNLILLFCFLLLAGYVFLM